MMNTGTFQEMFSFTTMTVNEAQVNATGVDNARFTAITRVINEISREYAEQIDCIRVYQHGTDRLYKEYNIA